MQKNIGVAGIAPLQNVVKFDSLVRRLQTSPPNLPRIGVMYGNSGLGKTFAATFAANEHRAFHVQVGFSWTQRYFCKAVMVELTLIKQDSTLKLSIPEMVGMIAKEMASTGRLLIVDDAQYMHRKGMLDIITEIYETAQSPLIMLGEEKLPDLISNSERLHNRVLSWVEAKPSNLADCKALARIVCGEVEVATDLLEKICSAVGGCARRIVTNLNNVREFAAGRSLASIDAATYKDAIATGDHRSN